MSVHVNEFLRKKGKNDLKYIELLEETLKNQKEITAKAVAKIRELTKENKEIREKAIEEFSEQIKARAHSTERNDWSADYMISIWESVIDEIAMELKGE